MFPDENVARKVIWNKYDAGGLTAIVAEEQQSSGMDDIEAIAEEAATKKAKAS